MQIRERFKRVMGVREIRFSESHMDDFACYWPAARSEVRFAWMK